MQCMNVSPHIAASVSLRTAMMQAGRRVEYATIIIAHLHKAVHGAHKCVAVFRTERAGFLRVAKVKVPFVAATFGEMELSFTNGA